MGYTYFVIVEEIKTIFEVSRYTDFDVEYNMNLEFPDVHKSLKDITLSDMTDCLNIVKNHTYTECIDDFLILWLDKHNYTYNTIEEASFDKKDYKDYKIIYKKY